MRHITGYNQISVSLIRHIFSYSQISASLIRHILGYKRICASLTLKHMCINFSQLIATFSMFSFSSLILILPLFFLSNLQSSHFLILNCCQCPCFQCSLIRCYWLLLNLGTVVPHLLAFRFFSFIPSFPNSILFLASQGFKLTTKYND